MDVPKYLDYNFYEKQETLKITFSNKNINPKKTMWSRICSGFEFCEISYSAQCTVVAKLPKFNVAGGADHENFSKITFYSAFLQASHGHCCM